MFDSQNWHIHEVLEDAQICGLRKIGFRLDGVQGDQKTSQPRCPNGFYGQPCVIEDSKAVCSDDNDAQAEVPCEIAEVVVGEDRDRDATGAFDQDAGMLSCQVLESPVNRVEIDQTILDDRR